MNKLNKKHLLTENKSFTASKNYPKLHIFLSFFLFLFLKITSLVLLNVDMLICYQCIKSKHHKICKGIKPKQMEQVFA